MDVRDFDFDLPPDLIAQEPPAVRGGARHEELVAILELRLKAQTDAPSCHYCGSIMVRNGSCYRCMSCGSTSGCS